LKRIEFASFGDPLTVLRLADDPPVQPAAGEVRVHVEAAPINPADLLTIRGLYGQLPGLPAVPGMEGVGRVTEVGEDVTHLTVDDLVLLPLGTGTWRTQMTLEARHLAALPGNVDPLQWAMAQINPLTAMLLLDEIETLQPGDWVVLNAANSAVGHYVVELAARRGLKTLALVRRDGGVSIGLRELGATAVIVDQGQDLVAEAHAHIGESRAPLALDAVGGEATSVLANCLSESGTVAVYGVLSEQACRLPPEAAVFRDIRLMGFWLTRWFAAADRAQIGEKHDALISAFKQGHLRAEIEGTYPLDHYRDAVHAAAAGGRNGKILITPDAPSW